VCACVNTVRTGLIWEPGIHYAQLNDELNSSSTVVLFAYESPLKDPDIGAGHSMELPFVFGTLDVNRDMYGEGEKVDALSESMQSLWLMFASGALDPSTEYSAGESGNSNGTIIVDEDAVVLVEDPFGPLREFWQGIRRAGKTGDEAAAAAHSGGSKL
jgi:carboxylesterase type B